MNEKMDILVSFEDQIKKIPGSLIESTILVTAPGQQVMIVINKVLWHAVRILVERDSRIINKIIPIKNRKHSIIMFKLSEHWTIKGARERVAFIKSKLLQIPVDLKGIFPDSKLKYYCVVGRLFTLPDDVCQNPDKYLREGDHVQIERILYHHSAIYIGNSTLIHFSGPSAKKAKICTISWNEFISSYSALYGISRFVHFMIY